MTTLFLLFMIIMMKSINPLKMSLMLTLMSVMTGIMSFNMINSVFIPSVLIISFSSGMMILFSYCSMTTSHETKSKMNKKNTYYLLVLTMIFYLSPENMSMSLEKTSIQTTQTMMLITIMMMVILSMVSINWTFFNPTKKFMKSY